MVKGVCSYFDKRREWGDEKSSATGPTPARKFDEPSPARREETRDWLETGPTSTRAVKGPSGGAALEELTQMVCDLQIAQAQRESGGPPHDRRPSGGQRCIWCDAVGHNRRDCVEFSKALRSNVVYLWNGRVHASDTRRTVETKFGYDGMKRLVEEAAAHRVEGRPLFGIGWDPVQWKRR